MAKKTSANAPDHISSAVKRLGIRRPDQWLPHLKAADAQLAVTACLALGRTGRKGYGPALLEVLQGRRPSLWRAAGDSLSQLESKRMIKPLIALMLDGTRPAGQREAAAYALAFTWSGRADPLCSPLLGAAFVDILSGRQESPGLRGQAAEGLAYLYGNCAGGNIDRRTRGYQQAASALMTALADPSAEVRFWSAFALGSMRCRAALPELGRLKRRDKERFGGWWTVGEEASDAIHRIKGDRFPELRGLSPQERKDTL